MNESPKDDYIFAEKFDHFSIFSGLRHGSEKEKLYLEGKDLLPRFVPLRPDVVSVYHGGLT